MLQWTGIPVSVGIAATKTLAKVANHRAKKDPAGAGVCVIARRRGDRCRTRPAAAHRHLGHRRPAGAAAYGDRHQTPLALKQADARFIRERFSVTLERTVRELRGMPCIALEEAPPDPQERSWPRVRSAGW